MTDLENELILQYLRNITAKISVLFDRMDEINKLVNTLGRACGTAFHQTKLVVDKLAEATEDTRSDLSEITGSAATTHF